MSTFTTRTWIIVLSLFLISGAAAGQNCSVKGHEVSGVFAIEADCEAEEVTNSDADVRGSTVAIHLRKEANGKTAIAAELGIAMDEGSRIPDPSRILAEVGNETYELNLVHANTRIAKGFRIERKMVVLSKDMSIRVAKTSHFRVQVGDVVYNLQPATDQMMDVVKKIGQLDDNNI